MGHFTVWRLTSPSSGEVATVAHPMFPDDYRYEHQWQRIVYRGEARNKMDALARARKTNESSK